MGRPAVARRYANKIKLTLANPVIQFLNDKAQDSILSLIKGLDFNKALDKLYLFTDNPVAFELGAKATLTQEMRIRALSRLLKAFYAIFGDLHDPQISYLELIHI